MNPLTWLLIKLRRPATQSVLTAVAVSPTPTPSALTPAPVSPSAPPTLMQRHRRDMARQQEIAQDLRADYEQAQREGSSLASELPIELKWRIRQLVYNRADRREAQAAGWWAEDLRLLTEAQELETTIRFQSWQHALCQHFGTEVGTKLSRHEIEPGMTLGMVLAAFGSPAAGAVSLAPTDPTCLQLHYGSAEAGSLIEVREGLVVQAKLGTAAFPADLYNWPGVAGG